jgi:DNA mismatch endonuclease (patch repair protein)
VTPHPRWKDHAPDPVAWRPRPGLTRAERIAEQDLAAGGRAAREVPVLRGVRAHASVALRSFRSGRRIYAYLRWSAAGRTRERYVGEVDADTREGNLALAWQQVQARGLLDRCGD